MKNDNKKKYDYETIGSGYPAKVTSAKIIDQGGKPAVELGLAVQMGDETRQLNYRAGISDPEKAKYAVDAVVTAGFIGKGWKDIKDKGFTKETFEPADFQVQVQKVIVTEEGKEPTSYMQVQYINSGSKEFVGEVTGMEGSFMKAREKIKKPNAQQSTNEAW